MKRVEMHTYYANYSANNSLRVVLLVGGNRHKTTLFRIKSSRWQWQGYRDKFWATRNELHTLEIRHAAWEFPDEAP